MSYESTAGDLNKTTVRSDDRALAPSRSTSAPLEPTVLDEFRAQMNQLEQLQARVSFMLKEVQSLIKR